MSSAKAGAGEEKDNRADGRGEEEEKMSSGMGSVSSKTHCDQPAWKPRTRGQQCTQEEGSETAEEEVRGWVSLCLSFLMHKMT